MSRFQLEIDCDNAAFDPDPLREIGRILGIAAQHIANGGEGGPLYDINGNKVGAYWFDAPYDDDDDCVHVWVTRDDNEEISYCEICGADGNA